MLLAMDRLEISIVIPVRDQWAEAEECLRRLARQREIVHCEVILVDDGSRLQPPTGLEFMASDFKMAIIRHLIPLGVAAARNSGVAAAQGQAILFIDADCVPEPNFLNAILESLRQHTEDAAFQARLIGGGDSIVQQIEGLRLTAVQDAYQASDGHINYINTSGFAIRAAAAKTQGDLFYPGAPRGEDSLLLAELKSRGQSPRFTPEAVVRHCPRLTLGRYLKKHFWIGYGNGNADARLRADRILLTMAQRWAVCREMWRKARQARRGAAVFALAMLVYALEVCGRLAYRLFGMRPGRQSLLSTIVDPVRQNELLARILSSAQRKEGLTVTYLTSWSLVLARQDDSFGQALRNFDICYSDSIGVVYSLLLTRLRRIKKVTANVYFHDLCREAANRNLTIALVGSREGIAEQVAAQVREKGENLQIVLCSSGYLSGGEEAALEKSLVAVAPNIVVIGRGQPIQEEWALACRSLMPNTVFLCVGGLFDYLTGDVRQTPGWIRGLGFEWLHRFYHQPRRYWRIYAYGIPALGMNILIHCFHQMFAMIFAGGRPGKDS